MAENITNEIITYIAQSKDLERLHDLVGEGELAFRPKGHAVFFNTFHRVSIAFPGSSRVLFKKTYKKIDAL